MLIAGLFFSLMNVGVKLLDTIPAIEIVFFRAAISLVMSFAYLKARKINLWGSNKKLLILRGALGAVALVMYFKTLQEIPFASAVTLMQLSPVLTILLAVFLLGEKVKPLQWVFFTLAFTGVAMIKGFDPSVKPLYFMLGVGAAFIAGLAYNVVRKLRSSEHPLVIVFYFPLIATPIAAIASIPVWVMPSGWQWFILLGIGVATQLAQVNMTRSMQLEALAKVSAFRYLTVVYALFIGFFLFGEALPIGAFLGVLLVFIGIVANVVYTHKKQV